MRQILDVITVKNSNLYSRSKKSYNQSFRSSQLISSAFMAVNKHEILGVSAIDLFSMVIPRSIVDFTRNKEAGTETVIRESSSTATHAAIGVSGLGAAALLSQGLKHKNYGVDFKSVSANDDTVNAMAKLFKNVVDENKTADKNALRLKFLEKVFENVEGLGGNSDDLATTGGKLWFKLGAENKNKIIGKIISQMDSSNSFKLPSSLANQLEGYMNIDIPSTQNLKVNLAGKEVATKGTHFIADSYSLTKSFLQDNVLKIFKNTKDIESNTFIQDLKNLSKRKTVLGLAAICAVALSMQAINRHLTKKRTGKDGFVGDPNYNKKVDESQTPKKNDASFIPLKLLSVVAMGFFIFKTVNAASLKDFFSKIQFKGILPTVNQIKIVYGSTILGRLIAASDKNELRESAFRDFLGYTNFLVLGALVTKWFVNMKDKSLINYDSKIHGKGSWNWLKNSSIKTHEEVINYTLKNDVVKDNGVMPLKEIYKNGKINGDIAKKLGILNKAKLLGMLYACIALGIIVPLINKHMTQSKNKKQMQQENLTDENNFIKNASVIEKSEKTQKIINDFLNNYNK